MEAKGLITRFDGFLVCCCKWPRMYQADSPDAYYVPVSDHPLVHILRERITKPSLGIFEAAIVHSLLVGNRFGIITTGTGSGHQYLAGVRNFFGATTDRFTGVICAGLGVVELRTSARAHVERRMKEESVKIAKAGADVIVLGCAGMTGMEKLVQQGVLDAELPPVKVVDGAKAGLQMVASLARLKL
ncbi:hypothetical protein BDQ17DRAFT_1351032 [Cyathus striatus]|nr:hypothetical protein BDQ17DRAFT_1351032 [Cyathus striatus]